MVKVMGIAKENLIVNLMTMTSINNNTKRLAELLLNLFKTSIPF